MTALTRGPGLAPNAALRLAASLLLTSRRLGVVGAAGNGYPPPKPV